jgi:hypothetical protein
MRVSPCAQCLVLFGEMKITDDKGHDLFLVILVQETSLLGQYKRISCIPAICGKP